MKKPYILQIFIIVLGLAISIQKSQAALLSNELPVSIVDYFQKEQVWGLTSWDNPNNDAAKEVYAFWKMLLELPSAEDQGAKDSSVAMEKAIDSIFGILQRPLYETSIDAATMYWIKFQLIRLVIDPHFEVARSDVKIFSELRPKIQKLYQKWLLRYVDMALVLIETTGISSYQPILKGLRHKISTGKLKIIDLSPAERNRNVLEIQDSHGVNILSRKYTGIPRNYEVLGFFNNEKNVLSVDFSRPIEETIVTFSHEIVHAADPKLDRYREQYIDAYDRVVSVFKRWTLSQGVVFWSKLDFLGLINHAFENIHAESFVKDLNVSRQKIINDDVQKINIEIEKLREDPTLTNIPDPSEAESLKTYIHALVGLTLENEYKAYYLSNLVYLQLRNLRLINRSQEKDRFSYQLSQGDEYFVLYLSSDINPIPKLRSELSRLIGVLSKTTDLDPDQKKQMISRRFSIIFRLIEKTYYQEVTELANVVRNNDLASYYRELYSQNKELVPVENLNLREDFSNSTESIPSWTDKGRFGLPTNPNQILRAIPTTAWVVGFKNHLDSILKELKKLSEPLVPLRAGVLDLHHLTWEEMHWIGLLYTGSPPYQGLPPDVTDSVKYCLKYKNPLVLDSKSPYAKYFTPIKWSENLSREDKRISAFELTQNIIRLHLVKAAQLLAQLETPLLFDSMAIRSIQEKLSFNKTASKDEFSEQKKEDLNAELVVARGINLEIKNQILDLRILLDSVGVLYSVTATTEAGGQYGKKSSALLDRFLRASQSILQGLERRGVEGGNSLQEGMMKVKKDTNNLKGQLARYAKQCPTAKGKRLDIHLFQNKSIPFTVGDAVHPLMLRCFNGELFAINQPCNYDTFLTTQMERKSGAQEYGQNNLQELDPDHYQIYSRVFFGTRDISPLFSVNLQTEKPDENSSDLIEEHFESQPSGVKRFFNRIFGSRK